MHHNKNNKDDGQKRIRHSYTMQHTPFGTENGDYGVSAEQPHPPYRGGCLCRTVQKMPTLSRTTVYNTLRLLSEHNAARMITIDEHRVCYDGNTTPHVHFYCKKCGHVTDFFDEPAPIVGKNMMIDGNAVDEMQLYYKGICSCCLSGQQDNK